MPMVVDLPAPLGPSNPNDSPSAIENETSSTAWISPNRRFKCLACSMLPHLVYGFASNIALYITTGGIACLLGRENRAEKGTGLTPSAARILLEPVDSCRGERHSRP